MVRAAYCSRPIIADGTTTSASTLSSGTSSACAAATRHRAEARSGFSSVTMNV